MSNTLRVGFARKCITPNESVPLGGYGNSAARMSQKVLSDIYTVGLAFTDDSGNTVLLLENDLLFTAPQVFNPIREEISQKTGIPFDSILAAATHTHSGPDIRCDHPAIHRYLPYLHQQVVACALEALADCKTASVSAASTKTKDMAYVRHYVLEDGSYKGVNLNVYKDVPIAYHSSEADNHLQVVNFHRQDGKDIVLVNWQAHPHLTGFGKADLSADIPGVVRDTLEEKLNCHCIYFSGASGNINILSFDQKENHFPDYLDHGRELSRYVLEAMSRLEPLEDGNVALRADIHTEPLNKPDESLLDTARDIKNFFETNKIYKESLLYAESKGFHSQYQATNMLQRHQLYEQGDRVRNLPIHAFRAGGLAFVTAPYEMFDTNGKYIRDFSPFPVTIVVTCANAYFAYIPSAYGYLNDCYEADAAQVPPGSGERLAQHYIQMLRSLTE